MSSRRDFLKHTSAMPLAATIPAFFAGQAIAATEPQRTFVWLCPDGIGGRTGLVRTALLERSGACRLTLQVTGGR